MIDSDATAVTPRARATESAIVIAFAAVVSLGAAVHESWWDEAQVWLLARDASLGDLLLRRLAYEGHPPLWYLLVAIPAKLGLPYFAIHIVATAAALAGVVILVRQRYVPLIVRAMLPFTLFFAYQYTVVARGYVLIPPLLFAIATIYRERDRRVGLFAVLLALLSNVSIHGLSLAWGFVVLFVIDLMSGRLHRERIPRRAAIAGGLLLVGNTVALALILRTPRDLLFLRDLDFTFRLQKVFSLPAVVTAANLFGGAGALAALVAVLIIIVLLLWLAESAALDVFLLLTASLLPISSVYFAIWHEGVFFLVLLFAVLIAFQRRVPRIGAGITLRHLATLALVIVLARQAYWTFESLWFDARYNFTGSRDAARFIRTYGLDRARLFGAGVRCIELQPYFRKNIFANYRVSDGGAYWDGSNANPWLFPPRQMTRVQQDAWMAATLAGQPDYLVVSVGYPDDYPYRAAMAQRPDYRRIAAFPGGFFWKDSIHELIEFDIYQRQR